MGSGRIGPTSSQNLYSLIPSCPASTFATIDEMGGWVHLNDTCCRSINAAAVYGARFTCELFFKLKILTSSIRFSHQRQSSKLTLIPPEFFKQNIKRCAKTCYKSPKRSNKRIGRHVGSLLICCYSALVLHHSSQNAYHPGSSPAQTECMSRIFAIKVFPIINFDFFASEYFCVETDT